MKQLQDRDRIAEQICMSENVLLFTHMNMDGDAAGSAAALCEYLRSVGKNCEIIIEDPLPDYLSFLDRDEYFVYEPSFTADMSVSVDCGDSGRLGKREELFFKAPVTVCIDHHKVREVFASLNDINPGASAAGVLIYELLLSLNAEITKTMAEALYVAIITDTGSFCYANTNAYTHRVVASLYDTGFDHVPLCNKIYFEFPAERIKLERDAMNTLEIFAGGKAAIAYATLEMFEKVGAKEEHAEKIVEKAKSIEGVEVAAFLREKKEGGIKVSFRAKSYANVEEIAAAFGGGGHVRASGCTLQKSMSAAIGIIKAAVEDHLEKYENLNSNEQELPERNY